LLQGRDFTSEDNSGSQKVAIISAEFARRYFGNADPLGEHVRVGSTAEDWVSVVGVTGDVQRFLFDRGMRPAVYLPHQQMPVRSMHFVVRTRGNPENLASAIRAQLANVDKKQPLFDIKSIETIIDEQVSGVRVGAGSMAFYGLLALLLSALGVYGVVAHSVQQRTREIGIRMAVGARSKDIVRMVVNQTLYLTAVGLGAGLLAALAMELLMAKAMFGIMALDPLTLCLSMALLATIALLAGCVPARRAAHVDPMITLRCESILPRGPNVRDKDERPLTESIYETTGVSFVDAAPGEHGRSLAGSTAGRRALEAIAPDRRGPRDSKSQR